MNANKCILHSAVHAQTHACSTQTYMPANTHKHMQISPSSACTNTCKFHSDMHAHKHTHTNACFTQPCMHKHMQIPLKHAYVQTHEETHAYLAQPCMRIHFHCINIDACMSIDKHMHSSQRCIHAWMQHKKHAHIYCRTTVLTKQWWVGASENRDLVSWAFSSCL